jgi:hypothetical protein
MDEPTKAPEKQEVAPADAPEPSRFSSHLRVMGLALVVALALLALVVWGLSEPALLPANYQGFDGR